ncbi:MAG TPA: alpha/beta fold hydrolase [Steroidobacteraceae bacterium]|nr:alpha/beta fold hydrolase [Steroidobacteraceae bacterium]
MRIAPRAVGAGALLLLGLSAGTAAAAESAPGLVLSACELEHPLRFTVVAAECGVLSVAENPQDPAGRHIALHVARVPAISRRKQADALFILAGGPGAAASSFYTAVAGAFARVHRERDIVLIDQRGTGESSPLDCAADAQLLYRATQDEIAADTRRCLAALSARADVAYYTTSLAVQDLERVRAALGVGRIDLYGSSYGTRVAQHYLRRFPQRVRALILDGVVPAPVALGPATASDAERALLDILARCAGESACRARYGDPARSYHSVRSSLANHAVPVTVADPSTGEATRLTFGTEHLATVLRLGSYTAEYAALLPLLLDAAAAHQDYGPLAAQFLLIERGYGEALASGMHNSVVCAEDVPFYDARAIDRARLADTFLGTLQLDGLESVCRVWPHGPIDADLHAPLQSDVPALLLSGSDDPVTPPAFAQQAARGFPHGLSIVLEGFGHGALTAPCMDRVLAQFLERASVVGLDVGCTRRARPLPFFTSLNGPPP